jgi:hypothetical protein
MDGQADTIPILAGCARMAIAATARVGLRQYFDLFDEFL